MIIASRNSLRIPYLDLKMVGALVPFVSSKAIRNMADRELVLCSSPAGEDRRWTIANAVSFGMIDVISNGGSTLNVGRLVASAATHRLDSRLKDRTLGTAENLLWMVYHIEGQKVRGRGFVAGNSMRPKFCTASEIADVVVAQAADAAREVRTFPVDRFIEEVMERFKSNGGQIV